MSKISGHFELTNQALNELKVACGTNPVVAGVPTTSVGTRIDMSDAELLVGGSGFLIYNQFGVETPSPSHGAVLRDLRDIYNGGHWRNHAQKHHFMRRFTKQNSLEAWEAGVDWILTEAEKAMVLLCANIEQAFGRGNDLKRPPSAKCKIPTFVKPPTMSANVFRGAASDRLGSAVHAVQDSFSASHVKRIGVSATDPGEISKIYVYEGSEKEGHSHADEGWGDENSFSRDGRHAIAATKALIELVLKNALKRRQKLKGKKAFRNRWLRASKRIHTHHEDVTEAFIEKHTFIHRSDLYASKAIRGEELGRALFTEHGANAKQVYDILLAVVDEFENSSDDVAEAYVREVMGNSGSQLKALRSNRALIRLLIKVMDEGWTTAGEQDSIDFLKAL